MEFRLINALIVARKPRSHRAAFGPPYELSMRGGRRRSSMEGMIVQRVRSNNGLAMNGGSALTNGGSTLCSAKKPPQRAQRTQRVETDGAARDPRDPRRHEE